MTLWGVDWFVFAESERGDVYSWGSGQYGKLGHNNLRDRFLPLRIGRPFVAVDQEDDAMDIVHVACNRFHSAAVTGELLWKSVTFGE